MCVRAHTHTPFTQAGTLAFILEQPHFWVYKWDGGSTLAIKPIELLRLLLMT